jgi:hypothetical protein
MSKEAIVFMESNISAIVSSKFPVTFLYNDFNIGQIASVDKAYSYVETPYIFHLEDDWEFYAGGFIEESLDILLKHSNVLMVALRAHNDVNFHPFYYNEDQFFVFEKNHYNMFSGFGFHPGLRRTIDYLKVAPFLCSISYPYFSSLGMDSKFSFRATEYDIHLLYNKLNIQGALTAKSDGYIRHTGGANPTIGDFIKLPTGIFKEEAGGMFTEVHISIQSYYCGTHEEFLLDLNSKCQGSVLSKIECNTLRAMILKSGALERFEYIDEHFENFGCEGNQGVPVVASGANAKSYSQEQF